VHDYHLKNVSTLYSLKRNGAVLLLLCDLLSIEKLLSDISVPKVKLKNELKLKLSY